MKNFLNTFLKKLLPLVVLCTSTSNFILSTRLVFRYELINPPLWSKNWYLGSAIFWALIAILSLIMGADDLEKYIYEHVQKYLYVLFSILLVSSIVFFYFCF